MPITEGTPETERPIARALLRVDSVQLLRAIAAVAVVTHHLRVLANGAWGVDLFFSISGFIICYVTADSSRHFLAKRAIRIVPLYWAGTIAVFGVACVAPSMVLNTTTSLADLFNSLAFIPYKKGGHTAPVLFLGWTLNYEVFFYLFFALSMSISIRYRIVICSMLLIGAASLGASFDIQSVPLRFFTRPIVLEFVLGMLCYVVMTRTELGSSPPSRASIRWGWCLLGGALLICLPLADQLRLPEERLIRWGLPAALAFFSVVQGLRGVTLPRWLILIGDASYSLYLFHPYLIQILTKAGAFAGNGFRTYILSIVTLVLCVGLSVLSYIFVERPTSSALRRYLLSGRPAPVVSVAHKSG